MKKPATKKDIKTFGIGLAVILTVISGILFYKHGAAKTGYLYFLGVAATLLILSLAATERLRPVYNGWMKVAGALGWFNTRLLLCIIYYLVFTPTALICRLLGMDLLDIKIAPQADSCWKVKDSKPRNKQDYEKQF